MATPTKAAPTKRVPAKTDEMSLKEARQKSEVFPPTDPTGGGQSGHLPTPDNDLSTDDEGGAQ